MRHWLNLLGATSVALLMLIGSGPAAAAQPRFVGLSCDTLTTSPDSLRIAFEVVNDGSQPVCTMLITGGPDEEPVFCTDTPPDWTCAGVGGGPVFSTQTHCIAPGATDGPFAVITGRWGGHRLIILYFAVVTDPGVVPTGPWFGYEVVYPDAMCSAVPTRVGTWGQLKAVYR